MVRKIKSPKQAGRVKSPKYSKFPVKIKKITPKGIIKRRVKVGAYSIPSAIWRAGHPKPLRKPMAETLIRKGMNFLKPISKEREKLLDAQKRLRIEHVNIARRVDNKDYNLIEIELSSFGENEIVKANEKNPIKYNLFILIIAAHFRSIWRKVNQEYEKQKVKVAKDTGALRVSLGMSLRDSGSVLPPINPFSLEQLILKMGFESDLPYAKYISKGAIQAGQRGHTGKFIKLKHSGKISKRTGRPLSDPFAEKNILHYNRSTILRDFRRVIRYEMRKMFRNTAKIIYGNISATSLRNAKKCFLIKHLRGRI